jgi:hypothetical protein
MITTIQSLILRIIPQQPELSRLVSASEQGIIAALRACCIDLHAVDATLIEAHTCLTMGLRATSCYQGRKTLATALMAVKAEALRRSEARARVAVQGRVFSTKGGQAPAITKAATKAEKASAWSYIQARNA